ncbi:hypothetical protein LAUMK41_00524 [Mycobacterium attenuatum]|nr:hypothetical protein LAUMK41_00524 [Mycobacterium attenuatum]
MRGNGLPDVALSHLDKGHPEAGSVEQTLEGQYKGLDVVIDDSKNLS